MTQLAHALERVPPHSLDAEMSVLGSMLVSRNAVERALEMLRGEDFYRDPHRRIFEAISDLTERDEPADYRTVSEELRRRGYLETVGGQLYLMQLIDSVPTAAHIEYYARLVEQKGILRRLIEVSSQITGMAYEHEEEVDTIVDNAERLVFGVAQRRLTQYFYPIKPLLFDAAERLEQARVNQEHVIGMTTGFERLDHMTSGLQPGDLIIVAGRPSMGKTALCLNIATNCASGTGQPVAVFSLEMSKEQLVQRMICSEARVDASRLRTGYLKEGGAGRESDWVRFSRAIGQLGDMPVYIDDSSDISSLDIRAKCRRLKAEHGLSMVVIDYLQLIRGHGRTENRNQEISLIARSLKGLAREMNVPVVALSQLSRTVERRDDKRPMLSDLRESGSIEAEADLVMMLYRSSYYNRGDAPTGDEEDLAEEAELLIAKHRNGPTGTVRLAFIRRFARFEDLDETHNPGDYGE